MAIEVKHKNYFAEITVAQVKSGMFDYGHSEHGPIGGGSSAPWYGNAESRYFPTADDAVLHAIESFDLNAKWPSKIKEALEKLKSTLSPSGRVVIPTGTQLQLEFA